jgi:SNF2 family DNA or RNA helicase
MKISPIVSKKFILTGTPVQNNLTELHTIFNFIDATILGDEKSFKKDFAKIIVAGAKVLL